MTEDGKCGTCQDTGLVICHHWGTERDGDGWCVGERACDSPADQPVEHPCPDCQWI